MPQEREAGIYRNERKLADVLRDLSPLPAKDTLPDVDDLEPLDSDPLE